ncbi:DUF2630 family protein [Rhodococcus sp. X156]|uniref:DUF2630 family protein n=1 Tax=Rhodococcus sp. X156 TaxID=2499145 RepID=UPI000FDB8E37|nr:DUF2630 family protein [Rhodococcus sp. X156]
MDDAEILQKIQQLVSDEHALRTAEEQGEISPEEESRRVQAREQALDQCWDLLRQRRARRDAGEDPDTAAPRPTEDVEGYLQ